MAFAQRLGLDLVGKHAERPYEGEARGDHGRELAAHQCDIFERDAVVMPGMLISRFKLIETGFISTGA